MRSLAVKPSAGEINRWRQLLLDHGGRGHGAAAISAGVAPDLRYSGLLLADAYYKVALGRMVAGSGMASFGRVLEPLTSTSD